MIQEDIYGVYISTAVFSCILGIAIYLTNSKITKNNVISFVLTIGAIYLLRDYIAARAQLVTFILFILTVLFIELFISSKKKRYAVFLIVISFFIANMHVAVWPFFFVIFLPYVAEYLLCVVMEFVDKVNLRNAKKRLDKLVSKNEKAENQKLDLKIKRLSERIEWLNSDELKEKRQKIKDNPYKVRVEKTDATKWLILVIVICLILGVVASFGDNPYTHLYKLMSGNTTSSINEHQPLVLSRSKEFMVIIVMFLSVLLFTDTKIRLRDLFMLSGMLLLAFMSKRQISMFVIICSCILNRLICEFINKYDPTGNQKATKMLSTWVSAIVIFVLVGLISYVFVKPKLNDEFVNTSTYPVEATKFIVENLDVDNIRIYNEYNYGSYLMSKGVKVFIDSRCDLYTKEFNKKNDIFSDFIALSNVNSYYQGIFDKYQFTHIMMYKNAKLNLFIKNDNNYNKIYEDDSFIIYEKK